MTSRKSNKKRYILTAGQLIPWYVFKYGPDKWGVTTVEDEAEVFTMREIYTFRQFNAVQLNNQFNGFIPHDIVTSIPGAIIMRAKEI